MVVAAGSIWIAEDEAPARDAMKKALTREGHDVETFPDGAAIQAALASRDVPDVVITDIRMPGADGIAVLRAAKQRDPDLGVILVTAFGSVESAVEAMKLGADDYVTKPLDIIELRLRVAKLVEQRRLRAEIQTLRGRLDEKFGLSRLVGSSPAMQRLFEQIRLVASTKSTVLITGESGTGKELIANAIHQNSPRRAGPFEPVNCAAIQATVLESEIFGHERGAFTGANARKLGRFELAQGGTLFLDEIGETPPDFQVKLLRFLESRELQRVGGTETIVVDSRLIAATNVDLEEAVAEGTFRKDLYFRLKVVTIQVPPLRDRRSDIPLLAQHFVEELSSEHQVEPIRLSPDAMQILTGYAWPGNVRELKHTIESLQVLRAGQEIGPHELPPELESGSQEAAGFSVGMAMDEIERNAILETLRSTGGNRSRAAEILGIGLRTLQRKLKDYREAGLFND